jgi:hypothetical protein
MPLDLATCRGHTARARAWLGWPWHADGDTASPGCAGKNDTSGCVCITQIQAVKTGKKMGGEEFEVVRPERFELPTPCFVGKCSIQLSYGRTRDATAGKQALSRRSIVLHVRGSVSTLRMDPSGVAAALRRHVPNLHTLGGGVNPPLPQSEPGPMDRPDGHLELDPFQNPVHTRKGESSPDR